MREGVFVDSLRERMGEKKRGRMIALEGCEESLIKSKQQTSILLILPTLEPETLSFVFL